MAINYFTLFYYFAQTYLNKSNLMRIENKTNFRLLSRFVIQATEIDHKRKGKYAFRMVAEKVTLRLRSRPVESTYS